MCFPIRLGLTVQAGKLGEGRELFIASDIYLRSCQRVFMFLKQRCVKIARLLLWR